MIKCETCGTKSEGDWGPFFGLAGHGKLCNGCALEYFGGVRTHDQKKAEKREVLGEVIEPLKKEEKAPESFVPRDVRGLKLEPGPVAAKFKGGSLRQLAYQQALANSSELTVPLLPHARWLVQQGYLRVVDQGAVKSVVAADKAPEAGNVVHEPVVEVPVEPGVPA